MGFYKNAYGEWDYLNERADQVPEPPHTHEFPNTGLRKSWCRVCDAEGEFSTECGKYVTVGQKTT